MMDAGIDVSGTMILIFCWVLTTQLWGGGGGREIIDGSFIHCLHVPL